MGDLLKKGLEMQEEAQQQVWENRLHDEQAKLEELRNRRDAIRKKLYEYHMDEFPGRVKTNEYLMLEQREKGMDAEIDRQQVVVKDLTEKVKRNG